MAGAPGNPNVPGGGLRQQRAAQLKAEMEAEQTQTTTQGEPSEHAPATGAEPAPSEASSSTQQTPESQTAADDTQAEGAGPVGQGDWVVKEGDCISSIAKDTGHFWETIWNDPGNAELKEAREDPNVLLPGDRVTVPEVTPKQETGETEVRHRFIRRGEPAMLRIRLFADALPEEGSAGEGSEDEEPPVYEEADGDEPQSGGPATQRREPQEEPLANQPYEFTIDGRTFTGHTDPNGALSVPIPPNARRGLLFVGEGPTRKQYEFELGHVDPIDEMTGVQQRLNNLGCDCGAVDGRYGPRTREALQRFQRRHGLEETGRPDEQTRQRLVQEHGS